MKKGDDDLKNDDGRINGRINELEAQIRIRTQRIKIDAFDIGRILCEVKKELAHGKFKKWVKGAVDVNREMQRLQRNIIDLQKIVGWD